MRWLCNCCLVGEHNTYLSVIARMINVYIDIETVPLYGSITELDPIGLALWEAKYSKEIQEFLLITPKNLELAKQEHWMGKA